MKWLTRTYQVLLALTIFLIPSNLFLKFVESSAYVNGLLIDYLIPKLYLSDLLILLILGLWLFELLTKKGKKKLLSFSPNTGVLFFLVILLLVVQSLSTHPISSWWYFSKILEMVLLAIFITQHRFLLKKIFYVIVASSFFQSLLAIYQYHSQSSLLGYFLLGEPNLRNYIGLAKSSLLGIEKILPYGTTAHPNILGGFLALTILFTLYHLSKKGLSKRFTFIAWISVSLSTYALILTQSISAWLTLVLGIGLFLIRNKIKYSNLAILIVGLIFISTPVWTQLLSQFYPSQTSFTRRAYLNQAAIKMFARNPIFGIGLNNFTARVEEYSPSREVVRFTQPVHHLGLLWLAETGILGAGLIILGFKHLLRTQYFRKSTLYFILPILPIVIFDHYLLTQQTGLLILVFWLTLLSLGTRAGTKRRARTR